MRYCSKPCSDIGRRKPIREMSEIEKAWLAGLFDGEGCISIEVQLNQQLRGVKIQVTNTNRELVDAVQRTTGIGYITTRYRSSEKHRPTHDWHTSGGNAKEILRLLSPYLIAKKEKAILAASS